MGTLIGSKNCLFIIKKICSPFIYTSEIFLGGIAGFIDYGNGSPPRLEAEQLSSGIAHRGPDSKGIYANKSIALAFRKFLGSFEESSQILENREWAIILDSRIYNFDENSFLDRWTKDEIQMLKHLRGPFTFAAWRKKTQ